MESLKQLLVLALLATSILAAPAPQVGRSPVAPRYGAPPPPTFQNAAQASQGFVPTPVQPILSEPSLVGVFSDLPDSESLNYSDNEGLQCQPASVQTVYLTLTESVPFRGNALSTRVKVYPTTVYKTLIEQQTSTIVKPVTHTEYSPRYITESVTRTEQTIYSLTTTHTVVRYQTALQTAYITQTKSVLRTQYVTQTKQVTTFITERETMYSTVTELRTRFITHFAQPQSYMYARAPTAPSPAVTKAHSYF